MQTATTAPSHGHEGEAVFEVDVQVVGLALVHRWTGWARDSQEATQRGFEDARAFYRGHQLVIRSATQKYRAQAAPGFARGGVDAANGGSGALTGSLTSRARGRR